MFVIHAVLGFIWRLGALEVFHAAAAADDDDNDDDDAQNNYDE